MSSATVIPSFRHTRPRTETISYETFLERYMDCHAEWVDGAVIRLMSASNKHQKIVLWLSNILNIFIEHYDLGWLRTAPFNMKLSNIQRGREPDILFVHQAREHLVRQAHLDGPADLVIEIISPESQERDRVKKFAEYQAGGVLEYWLIDPEMQTVTFYQRDKAGLYQQVEPNKAGIYHSAQLYGLQFKPSWLWQEPLPKVLDVVSGWGLLG